MRSLRTLQTQTGDVSSSFFRCLDMIADGSGSIANATFKFPARGGTGAIWKGCSDQLPSKRQRFGGEKGKVEEIHPTLKTVVMADGRKIKYNKLVSTLNINQLLSLMKHGLEVEQDQDAARRIKAVEEMQGAAKGGLKFSNTIVLGLGIRGSLPHRIGDKCKHRDSLTVSLLTTLLQAGSTFPKTILPSTELQSFQTTLPKTVPEVPFGSKPCNTPTPASPSPTPPTRKGLTGA